MKPTYIKKIDQGFEFGMVQISQNRRKDKLVKIGTRPSYEEAELARKSLQL